MKLKKVDCWDAKVCSTHKTKFAVGKAYAPRHTTKVGFKHSAHARKYAL